MATVAAFLKPTRIKLVSLLEWTLFILLTAARGELETTQHVLVAVYPLLFFYLVGCALAAASERIRQIASGWPLWVWGAGLAALDQGIKAVVTAWIPYQASAPIVANWLHLAHEQNPHGSWIASVFSLQPASGVTLLQWGLALLVLPFSMLGHRYYVVRHRKSLWADVALLGLFAGYASWGCDMAFRGHIVDFIQLPGLMTADLKDIWVIIGVAALFAEVLDNPELSWRGGGWRKEKDDLIQLLRDLYGFATQEVGRILDGVRRSTSRNTKRK